MPDASPLFWSVGALVEAYRDRELSPVEVTREALDRIEQFDPEINAFLTPTPDLALLQAQTAEEAYRRGENAGALGGVPIAIKDLFYVKGVLTTLGSLVYRRHISVRDSGTVRRLRSAGAVFTGKTNTAEFGQSATTENRLRDACRNPWDTFRTSGGSSGGSAAAVGTGLSSAALGSDGGGSIRIPAAFCGLFGFKPTVGLCMDENGFQGMTGVVAPGPITRTVADARRILEVLAERAYPDQPIDRPLRVGWCAQPEDRPVDDGVMKVLLPALRQLEQLGHSVSETRLPLEGWRNIFRVLVLGDERRARKRLLSACPELLSDYELRSLQASEELTDAEIAAVSNSLDAYRQGIQAMFEEFDLIVTPATATTAFPIGKRPRTIAGAKVEALWGAFPFCVPFNVAGCPAVSIPVGLSDGLPVAMQLVAPLGRDQLLLDVSEQFEQALAFDRSALEERWRVPAPIESIAS